MQRVKNNQDIQEMISEHSNKYQDITKLQYLHLRHCGLGTRYMDIDIFTSYLPMEEKNPRNMIYDEMPVQNHGENFF